MNNKIQQYVDEKYNLLESYIDTVINEKVPIGQYEKKGVELFLKYKDKYIYKPEAVKKVIKFFYLLRINNKNKYERFPLLDFQVFWLAALYGLYKTDTERLIKRCYLTQAKKNGKSSFSAGLALYEQIYDGELDASIVVLASSKEQATVVLDYIKAMIANSPELPELNVQRNSIFYNYKNTICKITVRAADSDKLQGINPSFSIIDEFGAHPSALLADRAFSAVSSRINPLQVIITTAYHNKDKSPAYELEQTAKNILDGIVEDDSFFCQVFSLDNPEEEFHKPELYRKANPALGKTVNPAILESSYKQSLLLPSKKHNFLTDNL
ncbi:MAG TPA: terminase large subunit, partial [Candidatus Dojkabacteria bacterium]|nr:terminase large subunit [Candidatus Dojkabacteria bacterium]